MLKTVVVGPFYFMVSHIFLSNFFAHNCLQIILVAEVTSVTNAADRVFTKPVEKEISDVIVAVESVVLCHTKRNVPHYDRKLTQVR